METHMEWNESYSEPLEAEYRRILEHEVEQQLQIEDLIRDKLIYLGDNGDYVYFCFDCVVKIKAH
jgi:hypothetical protein